MTDEITRPDIPSLRQSERPGEMLRDLEQRPAGYRELLEEKGSTALAGYRLAEIRLRAQGIPGPPSARQVHVCALEVHARAKCTGSPPTQHGVVAECTREGLQLAHR